MNIPDDVFHSAYKLEGGAWLMSMGKKRVREIPLDFDIFLENVIHEDFTCPFLIHIAEYYLRKDRSRTMFDEANERLVNNCRSIVYGYKWYDPRRYIRLVSFLSIKKVVSSIPFEIWEDI